MNPQRLYALGFVLVIVGFAVVVLGSLGSASSSYGGVIFVGPFPIVFGSGPDSGLVALTALIIAAVMVFAFSLTILLRRRAGGQT